MAEIDLNMLLPPDPEDQKFILKKYVDSMPTFSPATGKILQLASQLNATPAEIVAAIRLDPVLTGKVLHLVNSAYFSLAQKVTSLNRAVVYLGINTIKNLALSTAVMQAFETKNKDMAEAVRPTWYHSLATAVCNKLLAKAGGVDPKLLEEFFIAGLLHDVGKIILIQAFHGTTPHDGKLSLTEERARYGVDHCQVSTDTLRRWKFSQELQEAIAGYYMPPPGGRLAHFLHVADAMTYRLGFNGEGAESAVPHDIHPASWQVIGLSEEKAVSELASAPDQIQKAEIFLNIAGSKEKVVEKE